VKRSEFVSLPALKRRRFLQVLGAALAAPSIPSILRHRAFDSIGAAHALPPLTPTYFLEVNLRDQWDHGHVFVAPSLATFNDLRRGETSRRCALFFTPDQLAARDRRVFLTPQSMELEPHLDNIALIDCCELSVGAIHGHESANALRSPGRSYSSAGGKLPMFNNERPSNFPQGCEEFYSSTPTPASLHNYAQKQLDPALRNGFTFKGISRSIHTAYHFGAGLPGAELDRIQSKGQLLSAFPDRVEDFNILPTAEEADAVARILNRVDSGFLQRRNFTAAATDGHLSNLTEAQRLLYAGEPRVFHLPLTAEETAYWSAGVPNQACNPNDVKAQIWEQMAFAFKVLTSEVTRTVALEFDYVDVHDQRTPGQMETMTRQVVLPLRRMIDSLKAAGIWEQTLIAVYTTDGSRAPAAGSQGNEGKNSVLLAGGMIRGGYYGDVGVAGPDGDGHRYSYAAPRIEDGTPGSFVTDNSQRLQGKHVWRTVARALGIDDGLAGSFPDAADGRVLDWLLRS
jgi:hypothetical protein